MRISIVALLLLGISSASVHADSQRPYAVKNIQASVVSASSIRLNWSTPWDDVGVDGYNLYRDNTYFKTVFNTTNYIDQDLSANSHYEYTIVAFDEARNYSLMSSVSSASTGGSSSGSGADSSSTPSSPPPPVTAPPPPQENASSNIPDGYRQVFGEEFKSPSLDSSKWQSRYRWGPSRTINNEKQYYVDSLNAPDFGHSPFEFDGEHLTISATRTPGHLRGKANNKVYLSGALTTFGKFKMRYGYVEIRARLPKGKGLWPAFWLLHNQESGKRPEIDVVEMLGDNTSKIYQTYHYYDNWNLRSTPSYQYGGSDFSQNFHTFGMQWEPGRITWYVDGRATNSFSDSEVSAEDMYLLVNLAVGGSWPGNPDGSTSFPARLTIDYIRAYRPG